MTKSSNTTYALVVKGDSKTALAVGSGAEVQRYIRTGLMPGVWARQASLLEEQSCLQVREWLEDKVPEPLDGEHLTNLHDLQENYDAWQKEQEAARQAVIDLNHEAALQENAQYDMLALGVWLPMVYTRTKAMVERIKAHINTFLTPDQV